MISPSQAHAMVAGAVRVGWLRRSPCEECGDPNSVAHHDDYSQPLTVRWLCRSHHRLVHVAYKLAATKIIRIDKDVKAGLAELREGFETPNDVLRRLLKLDSNNGRKST